MKLSEKIMKGKETDFFCTSGMIVNSADRRVGANAVHGKGQLAIVSPGGMMYIPMPKENVVIAANDTEQLCLGVKMMTNSFQIEAGELALFSRGGASILLKNDGRILMTGEVYVNDVKLEVE